MKSTVQNSKTNNFAYIFKYHFGHHHQILPLMMMPKVVFKNLGKIVRFCYSALYSPS